MRISNERSVEHVLDTHHHVGQLSIGDRDESKDTGPSIAKHEAMLDRFAMSGCVVMPGLQYERPHGIVNTRAVNDAIAEYVEQSPRFVAALGTVEPLHGLALCRGELDRLADLGLAGVVWHTRFQGVATSDRRMHALIDEATARGFPCFVHMFGESNVEAPWMFAELARDHPEARIVILDGFSTATQVHYIMDLADRFDNLWFDTAICFPLLRPLDLFVQRFGSHRLLFGTDSYADPVSYNVPQVMVELLASDMAQEHLENIFWRNIVTLLPAVGHALERVSSPSSQP
jgi:hypothetical protein